MENSLTTLLYLDFYSHSKWCIYAGKTEEDILFWAGFQQDRDAFWSFFQRSAVAYVRPGEISSAINDRSSPWRILNCKGQNNEIKPLTVRKWQIRCGMSWAEKGKGKLAFYLILTLLTGNSPNCSWDLTIEGKDVLSDLSSKYILI